MYKNVIKIRLSENKSVILNQQCHSIHPMQDFINLSVQLLCFSPSTWDCTQKQCTVRYTPNPFNLSPPTPTPREGLAKFAKLSQNVQSSQALAYQGKLGLQLCPPHLEIIAFLKKTIFKRNFKIIFNSKKETIPCSLLMKLPHILFSNIFTKQI